MAMKETEFKILDTLSRCMGKPVSIKKLTEKIRESHEYAHYPEIYSKTHSLAKRGIIKLDRYGRSTVVSVDFAGPLLTDNLIQVELINKINFLESRNSWQTLILQINEHLRSLAPVRTAVIIRPVQYAKLNRIELLVILQDMDEIKRIQDGLEHLENLHNVRIDFLALSKDGFKKLLKSKDANPIKEVLSDKIAILNPQEFWLLIKGIADEGLQIQAEDPIHPRKISDKDIEYNLNRFGYREFGADIDTGRDIGTEYVTTSVLLKGDARKKISIPIILAKNSKDTDYDLLLFLSKKYGTLGGLIPYLKILLEVRPDGKLRESVYALGIPGAKIDMGDIREKMRLYNVRR